MAHLSPYTPAMDVYLYSFGDPGARIVLRHIAYGTVSAYETAAEGDYSLAIRPAGASASSQPVACGRAGSAHAPVGGGRTGYGGTAPDGPGSPVPWLAVIGAGTLLATTGGLGLHGSRLGRRPHPGA
jgi:hypothetical protein